MRPLLFAQRSSFRRISNPNHQKLRSSSSSSFSKRRVCVFAMATAQPPSSSPSEPVAPTAKWWTPDTIAVVTGGEF